VIRVLVADDQALVRGGFRLILEAQPDMEVVAEASDGRDAIAQSQSLRPDVVLMDIRMPGMDGLEATRRLLAAPDPPRVLMLTTFDLDQYVYDALRAGASGFLLKDVRPEQLADAVRVVAAGDTLLAPTITRRLVEQYVRRPRPGADRPPRLQALTERELDVLRLIARGRPNTEIATALFLSETTVKTHITHLFAKLDIRDRAQAVVLAYESGLVEPGTGSASSGGDLEGNR
jgi:DNA-binding NarL/FixJ family response regulator